VPPAAAVVLAVGVGALVAACSGDEGTDPEAGGRSVGRSSTIGWAADGDHLWLTSPDDDQLVEVDAADLSTGRRIPVDGQPEQLTVLGDRVLVTGAQRTSLAVVDVGGERGEVAEVPLPCGGARSVVAIAEGTAGATADLAVVTCPTDDLVVIVDLDAMATRSATVVARRPSGVAHDGRQLTVTSAGTGKLRTWDLEQVVAAADAGAPLAKPVATEAAWVDGERTASLLGPVDISVRGPIAAYQVVDNVRKLSSTQVEGDASYGTPLNGRARLEPALAGGCGARFADFGDPARVLAMPVALAADPDDELLWVVGEASRSVSVVRCQGEGGARSITVAAFDVGDGPRGIVLSPDGDMAWVDVGFDHQVARLELPDGAADQGSDAAIERTEPAAVVQRDVTDAHLSSLAQAGRSMFHDATDTHLTPFGVVACSSCHPDAADDGLRWRIETDEIPAKLRRTPPVWSVDTDVKPLHWDGEFTSTDDLVLTTIRELLGGDGLLVDTAAISAYLAEAQPPPPAPTDEQRAPLVADGEALFTSLGCETCHQGDAGSDGRTHDVLPPAEETAAQLDAVVTPSLTGTRGRAPWGHDGRATKLPALLRQHRDGDGVRFRFTDEEALAVAAYLSTR
jgi:hypothetical protein